MDTRSQGMRRYLYEHLFYETIKRTEAQIGSPIMVSAARDLRKKLDAKLRSVGMSMADADLTVPPVLGAIERVMQENVPGYQSLFEDTSTASPVYLEMRDKFFDAAGFSKKQVDGTVQPGRPGELGSRLLVSPFDPRWAVRATMKFAGSQQRFILDNEFEQFAGGVANELESVQSQDLRLYAATENGKAQDVGPAFSEHDMVGLTELMTRMSQDQFNDVADWVLEGARDGRGVVNPRLFMSPEALERSVAILDELRQQGVSYKVKRDRKPGQIRAEIEGTKISIRLTESRENESYVGRVHDDGVLVYYTFAGSATQNRINYTPTPQEAVNLLLIAQGKPVPRSDGKGLVGELSSHIERGAGGRQTEIQDTYHVKSNAAIMSAIGEYRGTDQNIRPGEMMYVRRTAESRTAAAKYFAQAEQGELFLQNSVETARENFKKRLDIDTLVSDFEEHRLEAESGEWFPEFSGDAEVGAIQRAYWDVLRGTQTTLLRPGATEDEYQSRVGVIGELQLDDDGTRIAHDMLVEEIAYVGTPEEKVREHADEVVDEIIGSYDLREHHTLDGELVERRFDPVRVARYMSSEFGQWRNNADIVAALRVTGIDPDELMGSSFYTTSLKDRLVRFDESTAVNPIEHEDPFVSRMGVLVGETIGRNGARVTKLLVDHQGVISWEAERVGRTGKTEAVAGEIGQVFKRGAYGEIVTQFAGGQNYLFAPGYEAHILPQKAGENLSVEERTVLRGYEQLMADQIQYQVSNDLLVPRTEVGEPTSLNNVYRRLYDVRHDQDFLDRAREEGLDEKWIAAILNTESRRVRYGSEIAQESTIHAEWRARNSWNAPDPSNDNFADSWILTGQRNMAVMTEEGDGYFDPVMTNGSVNQGITRYLVEGAQVDEATGKIIPSADKGDRAPLMKLPETEYMRYDPYDRQQMSSSNLLNASAVTEPVGVAMMTFGGWTADDPMVISKEFAEKYGIRGVDGNIRPLVPGDKLSDMHGNKGVISLVVDRDMDLEEAREQGLEHEVAWFKKNSNLDVVMSPFSAVSRFNGGTAREMMDGPVLNLDRPFLEADGSTPQPIDAALGSMRLIVTHKDVERGTRVYDDEALREGRGRKASSQLAWALGSQGCDNVMKEFYGPNNAAATNFREMLVTMGLDMEPDGTLRVGYDDMQPGNERRFFPLPEPVYSTRTQEGKPPVTTLNVGQMRSDFGALISDKGGDMELPFPLKFPTDSPIPKATDASWKLPVLSAHLRSGQDLDDGQSTAHDYTNQYMAIFESAVRYRNVKYRLETEGETLDPKKRATMEGELLELPRRAQSAFDIITTDLKAKRFRGKRNIFKEGLMSSRLPNSATAVWTSDPRLDVDQLAMGPAMAESLGFTDNDYALVWRDPVLRDGGVRYLRVAIDPRLTGVAINPVMDKCFDGDFDGDSVAVVRLTSDAARLEALQKLTVEANLLDLGQFEDDNLHPLAIQNSLDTKVSQHVNPELKDRLESLRMRANEIQSDLEDGTLDDYKAWEHRHELVGELSEYYRDALGTQFGDATLRFGEAGDHVKSVIEACIDTGAKGSMSKIADYCRHVGVDPVTYEDLGDTVHTRKEDEGVMVATAVKSHGTGVAGTFSQRGVKALRNVELKPVLELTYPVTQSVLQSKHDPVEAQHKYDMLMGPARAHWRGRKLIQSQLDDGSTTWSVARDDDGREMQASTEDWKIQFQEFYTSKGGLNVSVNPHNIEKVAKALTGPDGTIIDIEDSKGAGAVDLGSTMDRLAYGGDFDAVVAAAAQRENIFDGELNRHFAPYQVRTNQRMLDKWERQVEAELSGEKSASATEKVAEAPEMVPLMNRDVLAAHNPKARSRGEGRKVEAAHTVRAPRLRPVFVPETDSAEERGADFQFE